MNNFDQYSNDFYNPYYIRDNDFVNNNFIEESENHFVQGYDNAPICYNYHNQTFQNYYENYEYQNHETPNLSNRTNFISLQNNCFSGHFFNEMQQKEQPSHNQNLSPPQSYFENEVYFHFQNSESSTIPSLPSTSSISSNSEDSQTYFRSSSEDSEGCSSSDSIPSIKEKKKRGRKPLYNCLTEIKAARNKAQKKYAKKQKTTLNDLKTEVPFLEAENFKLEKQKQSLIKICRKMLFDSDLPKLDQSVVGAIIGFS